MGLDKKFETIGTVPEVKGICSFEDGLVHYGIGITLIDKNGNETYRKGVFDQAKSSIVVDVDADNSGGLWILTERQLLKMNKDKTFTVVLDLATENNICKDIQTGTDGEAYVLLKDRVIKVEKNFQHKIIYQEKDPQKAYYRNLYVDNTGIIYLVDFSNFVIIDQKGERKEITPEIRASFKKILKSPDNTLFILDYSALYTYKDGQFSLLVKADDISFGLRFFEMAINSSDDFFIYATAGNVFHYKSGAWINFTPPAGMRTGNYGEGMAINRNGDLWMSLRSWPFLLKFDSKMWHKYPLKKDDLATTNVTHCFFLDDDTYLCRGQEKIPYLEYGDSGFKPFFDTTITNAYALTVGSNGEFYYVNDGIYRTDMKSHKKIIESKGVYSIGVFGSELFYMSEGKALYKWKDGKSEMVAPEDHHLGFDHIGEVHFTKLSNGNVAAFSSLRRGLISVYDGHKWEKIISIEGKHIYQIINIITYKDKTYIVTKNGSVAVWDNTGIKWWYYNPNGPIEYSKIYRATITPDETIWYLDDSKLNMINKEGLRQFDYPISGSGLSLGGIYMMGSKSYKIFQNKEVLNFTLD